LPFVTDGVGSQLHISVDGLVAVKNNTALVACCRYRRRHQRATRRAAQVGARSVARLTPADGGLGVGSGRER